MALSDKHKNKLRRVIRVIMITVAVFLLLFALVVPVANNAIALGVENRLKRLPLPSDTQRIESTSVAGKIIGSGNGMQYFAAVLLESDQSLSELEEFYSSYQTEDFAFCVEPQMGSEIRPGGEFLMGDVGFHSSLEEGGHYILYAWGDAPAWARDWLDTDLRGH